jgi:flagella basal body P-ring formation protein FlgA
MKRCACMAVAVLAVAAASAGPRVSIELLPDTSVSSDQVALGQVARMNSPELALMRTLVTLPIGRAPRAGEPALVQRAVLEGWIRRATGLATTDVDWQGAGATRILRATQTVRGDDVDAAAAGVLREWLDAQGWSATVQVRHPARDLDVAAGSVRIVPRPFSHAILRHRMVVWVDLWVGDRFLRSLPVAFDVIAADGAQAKVVPAHAEMPPRVQGASDVPALVTRGEWATLRSTAGEVSLESRVEVLQDGRAGERVRVRQQGATGVVFARVVSASRLELAP